MALYGLGVRVEDVRELLKALAAADVRAVAVEKMVTERQVSGERASEALIVEAQRLRAEAAAAKDKVMRLVAE